MKRQTRQVLEYLQAGNTITQADAQRLFNCWRLASRISELRNEYGYGITTYRIPVQTEDGDKRSYALYAMRSDGRTVRLWEGDGPHPLQRCPACGGYGVMNAFYSCHNAEGQTFYVCCSKCGLKTMKHKSAQNAATEWNNNKQEDNT